MAIADNDLQTVQTYQRSFLAHFLNYACAIKIANKRFLNFQNVSGNLGPTVTFDTPPRMISHDGLVVSTFDSVEQNVRSLTVNKYRNVNFAFNAEQLVFYIDNSGYRTEFEKSAIAELGSYVEQDILSVIPSSTYRFYTAGVTGSGPYTPAPINSFTQLADMLAKFREYGAAPIDFKMIIPNMSVSPIIGSGLTQFALDRNNRIANSWELGKFQECESYVSNLLPLHTAGTVGNSQQLLTVVSVTRQADGGITSITFSGATVSDANAVKAYDLFQFQPTSGHPDVNFLSYVGHANISLPLQFEATANAAGAGGTGNVTVSVNPVIYDATSVSGNPLVERNQTTGVTIAAGMTVKSVPTHRCGLLMSGNPLFVAMPRLPNQKPFPTANEADEATGASMRFTTGTQFGGNAYGSILDIGWGKTLVDLYASRIVFPPTV